jgi:hypothetical protein
VQLRDAVTRVQLLGALVEYGPVVAAYNVAGHGDDRRAVVSAAVVEEEIEHQYVLGWRVIGAVMNLGFGTELCGSVARNQMRHPTSLSPFWGLCI